MLRRTQLVGLILCTFIPLSITGQSINIDSLDLDGDIDRWYDSMIGQTNSSLQIGAGKENYNFPKTVHPYFDEYSWRKGSIMYRDQIFKDVFLLYDLVDQNILLKDVNSEINLQPIILNQDQVQWFSIEEREFLKIKDYDDGFFEPLFEGATYSVYAKRLKEEDISSSSLSFKKDDWYLIQSGDSFHRIRNKGELFKLIDKNKAKLISKENKLKPFTRDGDHLAKLISIYEDEG